MRSGAENSRYYSLDMWRGLACLSVIVFHTVGSDGSPSSSIILTTLGRLAAVGWIGVPLFFVISGYCIAASASRVQPVKEFFFRRLRRIFPPLWIFLGITAVVVLAAGAGGLWGPLFGHHLGGGRGFSQIVVPTHLSGVQIVGNLTLTVGWYNWLGHAGGPFWRLLGSGWWLDHLWSLGYEEQFYAVVGVLLMILGTWWWLGVAGVTLGVALLWLVHGPDARLKGLFFDGYWLLFALGLLLFHHLNVAKGWQRILLPAALAIIAPLAASSLRSAEMTLPTSFGVATLFTVVLFVAHPWDRAAANLTVARPLAWCGRRCYSVYLLHWPVTKAITGLALVLGLMDPRSMWLLVIPATIASSLLVAQPFHQYVERRFMAAARA